MRGKSGERYGDAEKRTIVRRNGVDEQNGSVEDPVGAYEQEPVCLKEWANSFHLRDFRNIPSQYKGNPFGRKHAFFQKTFASGCDKKTELWQGLSLAESESLAQLKGLYESMLPYPSGTWLKNRVWYPGFS